MKGLATILRRSKIHQIKEALIRYDSDGKLEGKCAMGVISCKVGLKLNKKNPSISSQKILMAGGLSLKQITDEYPFMRMTNCYSKVDGEEDEYIENNRTIEGMIFHLNDGIGFSFKEIADFLETTFPKEKWAK